MFMQSIVSRLAIAVETSHPPSSLPPPSLLPSIPPSLTPSLPPSHHTSLPPSLPPPSHPPSLPPSLHPLHPLPPPLGYIGKLKLQIPAVRYIKSQPWVVQIDQLYVILGPSKPDKVWWYIHVYTCT